jgi:hypothetical protein
MTSWLRKPNGRLIAAAGIAVCAAALVAIGVALAQGIVALTSPTGAELVYVLPIQANGQPGAVQAQVSINQLRNTTGYQVSSSASGTLSPTTAVDNLIFTSALTGGVTVNLPASPPDGYIFSVVNGTGSAFTGQTITVATTDGSTIANGSTAASLGAASSQEWQYTAASQIWYRMR